MNMNETATDQSVAVIDGNEAPRKRNIFDIDAELDQIAMAFDQLADTGEESEVLAAIEAYFGDLLNDRDKKIDSYCYLIDEYLAKAAARKAEAARIAALAKTDENNAAKLKARLKIYFEANEITKMETKLHKLSIVGNGGVQALTLHPDVTENPEAILPKEFQKVTVTPNADAIRAELAKPEADQLPLIKQLAKLELRGTSLRIK